MVQHGVVDPQGRGGVARLQRVQGVVPPAVHRQQAAARPVVEASVEEVEPLGEPAPHLVHMDDGVDGPDVTGVPLDGGTGHLIGPVVVARFLQAERVHAQERPAMGVVRVPRRQGSADPVPQPRGVPREEVELMAHRQGERITRAPHDQVLQDPTGQTQIAVEPGSRRGHVHLLPPGQRRMVQPGAELPEPAARLLGVPGLGAQHPQIRRERLGQRRSGARGHGVRDGGRELRPEEQQPLHGPVQMPRSLGIALVEAVSVPVVHHRSSSPAHVECRVSRVSVVGRTAVVGDDTAAQPGPPSNRPAHRPVHHAAPTRPGSPPRAGCGVLCTPPPPLTGTGTIASVSPPDTHPRLRLFGRVERA